MSSNSLFSVYCGVVCGFFLMLLFGEKARAFVTNRSQWMADHPRGYYLAIILCALVLIGAGYLLSVRFK